jgi:hypothetical protein
MAVESRSETRIPIIVIQEDESFVSKNLTSSPSTTTTSIPSSSSTSSPASSPSPPPRKVNYLNEIYGYSNFGLMSQIEADQDSLKMQQNMNLGAKQWTKRLQPLKGMKHGSLWILLLKKKSLV